SDEGRCWRGADANGLEFVAIALIADVDVVAAVDQRHACLKPDTDVLGARAPLEGLESDGGVVVAGGVAFEREAADCCVVVTGGVGGDRARAAGGVAGAGGVGPRGGGAAGGVGGGGG